MVRLRGPTEDRVTTTARSPATCSTFLLSSYTHSNCTKFCVPDRAGGCREAHFSSGCF